MEIVGEDCLLAGFSTGPVAQLPLGGK